MRERIRYLCRTQLLIIDEIGFVTLLTDVAPLGWNKSGRTVRRSAIPFPVRPAYHAI